MARSGAVSMRLALQNECMTPLTSPPIDIFVVDDQRLIGQTLGIILRQVGYSVTVFDHPRTAIENLVARPRLLLTDQRMPEISGCELASIAVALSPATQVILFSSSLTPQDAAWRALLESSGEFRLLTKPLHPSRLIVCVREMIGMPAPQIEWLRASRQLNHGNDPRASELFTAGGTHSRYAGAQAVTS